MPDTSPPLVSIFLIRETPSSHREAPDADMKIAITKNGITKLGAPPPLDLEKYQSDKKIEDEEVLKILELPTARNTGKKKSKPKKKAKKEGEADAE